MKGRYYLLKHKEKNEYILSNYKSWGNYKLFSYNQVRKNDVLFNPNCECRKLMGNRWQQCFRGELNIKCELDKKPKIENDYAKRPNETQLQYRQRILQ